MIKILRKLFIIQFLFISLYSYAAKQSGIYVLRNAFMSRTISLENKNIHTLVITNKLTGSKLTPLNSDEFRIRISSKSEIGNNPVILTSKNFEASNVLASLPGQLRVLLKNKEYHLQVELVYDLTKGDAFLRKYLKITPEKDMTLERIDMESIKFDDIYQPYTIKQITSKGPAKWRPGLGQPLYTKKTATFWGVEFPAAYNYVENNVGYCGYLWGKTVKGGETYTTYPSVVGVGDNAKYIQDAFFTYIDKIRIRPLHMQLQYNSWFDYGGNVDKNKFAASVEKVNNELNQRGVSPLNTYVIDDGWEKWNTDWSKEVWKVNTDKFDPDFKYSFEAVKKAGSGLGLWVSPGCVFSPESAVESLRRAGLEALDHYMSMADGKYMDMLENRILEFTKEGMQSFKFDGLFGHLNQREFDLNFDRIGVNASQLPDMKGITPGDERLNDLQYDEAKTYYLVAGTERLIDLFLKMHKINPHVYVVISNGAYLSPWWLQYIDAIWMINAGDAASGSNRNQELVYRDGVYFNTWVKENTQFPLSSVFNHEPKKIDTGESVEQFKEYLYMNLSRATGFVELYIKPAKLSATDWDVLAEGIKWVRKIFPYFKHAGMHGGSPAEGQVYGYTGWNEHGGYISFHNPSETNVQTYKIRLDREIGLCADLKKLRISSPLPNASTYDGKMIKSGDELTIVLKPKEVKILEFNK